MAFNLDEKYVKEAEEELGAILPLNYKKIMQKSNGGCVIDKEEYWELFPIFDKSTKKRVSRTCNHIVTENKRNIKRAKFPNNILGIGSNACGDLLVIKKEKNIYKDEIYTWNHETGKIELLSNNFSELEIE